MDALDESPNTYVVRPLPNEVLDFIHELIKPKFPNLQTCVTGRPVTDIRDALDYSISRYISLLDKGGHEKQLVIDIPAKRACKPTSKV